MAGVPRPDRSTELLISLVNVYAATQQQKFGTSLLDVPESDEVCRPVNI